MLSSKFFGRQIPITNTVSCSPTCPRSSRRAPRINATSPNDVRVTFPTCVTTYSPRCASLPQFTSMKAPRAIDVTSVRTRKNLVDCAKRIIPRVTWGGLYRCPLQDDQRLCLRQTDPAPFAPSSPLLSHPRIPFDREKQMRLHVRSLIHRNTACS